MADAPRWSVVIPTWNGRHLLAEALDGLSRQTLHDFETIVVDDASDDDTCHWLRQHQPDVVSVELAQRRGLAHAINQGLAVARAERIAFLNNDAVPEREWLGELDRAFDEHPNASMLASRILLYATPDRLHAAGDFFTASGFAGQSRRVATGRRGVRRAVRSVWRVRRRLGLPEDAVRRGWRAG